MTPRTGIGVAFVAGLSLLTACTNDTTTTAPGGTTMSDTPVTPETSVPTNVEHRSVVAAGTTFAVAVRGDGPPVLVIHGAGEDAAMLAPFAERLAATGRQVVTYDRRGTGASGRDDWPGSGAEQHADDAAALLDALGLAPAQIVGLSSGGVVALDLAVRHPDVVSDALVWEAPAVGVVPGGDALTRQIMEPVEAHLDEHPGDFVGAQAILLSALVGFPVSVDDPLFEATRANAESMVRDDPTITLRRFTRSQLAVAAVTIARGTAPNEIVATAVEHLAQLTGRDPVVIDTDQHEAYLSDPDGFARAIIADASGARS